MIYCLSRSIYSFSLYAWFFVPNYKYMLSLYVGVPNSSSDSIQANFYVIPNSSSNSSFDIWTIGSMQESSFDLQCCQICMMSKMSNPYSMRRQAKPQSISQSIVRKLSSSSKTSETQELDISYSLDSLNEEMKKILLYSYLIGISKMRYFSKDFILKYWQVSQRGLGIFLVQMFLHSIKLSIKVMTVPVPYSHIINNFMSSCSIIEHDFFTLVGTIFFITLFYTHKMLLVVTMMFMEKSSRRSILTKSNNYPYLLASSNNKQPILDSTSVNGGSVFTKQQLLGVMLMLYVITGPQISEVLIL